MKKIQWWLLLCVFALAACSPAPAPAVEPVADEEMLELAPTPELEAQAEPYNITIRYNANVPSLVKSAIGAAKFRWERTLTRGVPGISNVTYSGGFCDSDKTATFSGPVDDIQIIVGVAAIDGPGGTTAESAVCVVRTGSTLPIVSSIIFDSADLNSPGTATRIRGTAIHEMAHTLGFVGGVFVAKDLVQEASPDTFVFAGQNAAREYRRLGGSGFPPLENDGQGHWSEAVFDDELMTPFDNVGIRPMSRLTIAAMQDLGYSVNYATADVYDLP